MIDDIMDDVPTSSWFSWQSYIL